MSQFELNKGDNFVIVKDISASMRATDCPGGMSRSDYVNEQCRTFAREASKYDPDGVTVILFGQKVHTFPNLKPDELDRAFDGHGFEMATSTHLAVQAAYAEHKAGGHAQTTVLVFTDGEPSDPGALLGTIAAITEEVRDEREFNIAFLTAGVISDGLRGFLDTLNSGIPGAKYDIVAVVDSEVDFTTAFSEALEG